MPIFCCLDRRDLETNSIRGPSQCVVLIKLFLGDSEGSKTKGLAAGLWCGAAGGVAHMVVDSGWIQGRTHELLVDLDLVDPETLPAQRETPSLSPFLALCTMRLHRRHY